MKYRSLLRMRRNLFTDRNAQRLQMVIPNRMTAAPTTICISFISNYNGQV